MQEWPEPVMRVQALAESGLSAIPRCYVKPPCDRPVPPAAAPFASSSPRSTTGMQTSSDESSLSS